MGGSIQLELKVQTNFAQTNFIFFSCDNSVELDMSQDIL